MVNTGINTTYYTSILFSIHVFLKQAFQYFNYIMRVHKRYHQITLDQISRSVVSDSLQPHESQHTRPTCPSPTPGVHSD